MGGTKKGKTMTIKELDDRELDKVNGGKEDWPLFSLIFLESIKTYTGTISFELKELINAIKEKDYNEVAILATPLIARDPFVKDVYFKYLISKN